MLTRIHYYGHAVVLVTPHTTLITQHTNACFTVQIRLQTLADMFVWINVIQDFIHQLIAQQINACLNVLPPLIYIISFMFAYFIALKMDFLQIIQHDSARTDVQTSLVLIPILVMVIQPRADVLINVRKVYGAIIILIFVCQLVLLDLLLKT